MKANEIKGISNIAMLTTYNAGQHYKFMMKLGKVFPTTKAQSKYYIDNGIALDVLAMKDVEMIESLLERNGCKGMAEYQYTKNNSFVRLTSVALFEECLRKEYGL